MAQATQSGRISALTNLLSLAPRPLTNTSPSDLPREPAALSLLRTTLQRGQHSVWIWGHSIIKLFLWRDGAVADLHNNLLVRVGALQEAQQLRLHRELPPLEVVAARLSMDSAVG
jgi:hypothetical protein